MASNNVSGVLCLCHGQGINPNSRNEQEDAFFKFSVWVKLACWAFKSTLYFVVPYNPHPTKNILHIHKIKIFFIYSTYQIVLPPSMQKTCYNSIMKILYVITTTDVGGAEQALVSLVRHVTQHHTVRVVCLKPLGPLADVMRSSGAEVISLEMTGAGLGMVSKLVREIETFHPDLVHAMLLRGMEFARLACAGRGVKLITTAHFDWAQQAGWLRCLDRMLKSLDTLSCAESASTYQFLLEKQHYPLAKTILVKNTVKKSLFFKDNFLKSRMREEKKILMSQVVFICVARLVKIKNPQGLLRAFSKIVPHCPDAKLVFVGEGTERKKLEKFIQENNLTEKVLLAGEQKNINDWLNMADVFVLPSAQESLPLALLEAQQAGLPCVVSNVGDMPRQVEHGKNGFVFNYKDETLLSCLLTELYENADIRQKMAENVIQRVEKQTDSNRQYETIYKQVINNKFSRENF